MGAVALQGLDVSCLCEDKHFGRFAHVEGLLASLQDHHRGSNVPQLTLKKPRQKAPSRLRGSRRRAASSCISIFFMRVSEPCVLYIRDNEASIALLSSRTRRRIESTCSGSGWIHIIGSVVRKICVLTIFPKSCQASIDGIFRTNRDKGKNPRAWPSRCDTHRFVH